MIGQVSQVYKAKISRRTGADGKSRPYCHQEVMVSTFEDNLPKFMKLPGRIRTHALNRLMNIMKESKYEANSSPNKMTANHLTIFTEKQREEIRKVFYSINVGVFKNFHQFIAPSDP